MIHKKEKELTVEELKKHLRYDEVEGNFYWLIPKQKRSIDKPAGTTNRYGSKYLYLNRYNYSQSRLVWFYMTGEWPDGVVAFKDGDLSNCTWTNLELISHELHSLRKSHKQLSVWRKWKI